MNELPGWGLLPAAAPVERVLAFPYQDRKGLLWMFQGCCSPSAVPTPMTQAGSLTSLTATGFTVDPDQPPCFPPTGAHTQPFSLLNP